MSWCSGTAPSARPSARLSGTASAGAVMFHAGVMRAVAVGFPAWTVRAVAVRTMVMRPVFVRAMPVEAVTAAPARPTAPAVPVRAMFVPMFVRMKPFGIVFAAGAVFLFQNGYELAEEAGKLFLLLLVESGKHGRCRVRPFFFRFQDEFPAFGRNGDVHDATVLFIGLPGDVAGPFQLAHQFAQRGRADAQDVRQFFLAGSAHPVQKGQEPALGMAGHAAVGMKTAAPPVQKKLALVKLVEKLFAYCI